MPDEPFTVDGITYDFNYVPNCIQPMFSVKSQEPGAFCWPPQSDNDPPTEEELDHWVRTGTHP